MDSLVRIGEPAPDFSLPDLGGTLHHLAAVRGKIVVVNFWSAECPHSERADHLLAGLLPSWDDRVQTWWVACNAGETEEEIRRVAEARRLSPVLLDRSRDVTALYRAQVTPHLFVVDAQGILRYMGAPDDVAFRQRVPTRNYLAEAVDAILRGSLPDPAETRPFGCAIVQVGLGEAAAG